MQQAPDKYSVSVQRHHVVLLGAGASRAAFPNGDKSGRKLPLMNDFVEMVDGLAVYLKGLGVEYEGRDFEDIYSGLYDKYGVTGALQKIEDIVYDYFVGLKLPDEPTLYDHLVLSLRGTDIIATFNWDPFLWYALCRNRDRVGEVNLPKYLFLHGNTGVAVCVRHKYISVGHHDCLCDQCGQPLRESKLLYPVTQKQYADDPFIKAAWDMMKSFLGAAYMFTIFGYSAPESDVEAIALLKEGWGSGEDRSLEQIQIVDVVAGDVLEAKWQPFICRTHFGIYRNIYNTFVGRHARRSCDALWDATMMCNPRREYPVPHMASWHELDEWLEPLLEAENRVRQDA